MCLFSSQLAIYMCIMTVTVPSHYFNACWANMHRQAKSFSFFYALLCFYQIYILICVDLSADICRNVVSKPLISQDMFNVSSSLLNIGYTTCIAMVVMFQSMWMASSGGNRAYNLKQNILYGRY